jgi:hypothetical protein
MKKVQTSKLPNKLNKQSLHSTLKTSFKGKKNMAAKAELAPTITAQTIKAAQEALNNAPSMSDAPGVDKIRELLFGNQMQDYDRRFSVMEERFLQKMRDMGAGSSRGGGQGVGPRPSGTDPGIGEAPQQGRRPTGQPGPGLH